MLRTRVATAAWLAPLALGLIFGLPTTAFALLLALLLAAGAWEFRRLAALGEGPAGWMLPVCQLLIILVLFLLRDHWLERGPWLLVGICLAWLAMFLRLRSHRPGRAPDPVFRGLSVASALAALTGAWIALVWLRALEQGPWWILCLLLIVWSADIGAYFAGRSLGKRKLAPLISPGKTVAGLNGGLVMAALAGWASVSWLPTGAGADPYWLFLAVLVALASAAGDLFISLHKRVTGRKDSGRLFPGHGGILDRIDSLLAGAPFFALGLALAGVS